MKGNFSVLAALLSVFLLSGCSQPAEAPVLSVTIGGTPVTCGLQQNPEDKLPFKELLASCGGIDGLYYNHYGDYGDPIQIAIDGTAPDNIQVFDAFVNEDGSISEEKQTFGFQKDPILIIHMAERTPAVNKLSGVVPERGSLMRGFRVRLLYGTEHFDYIFAVRTDAKIWQAAPSAVASTDGTAELFLNSTIPGYDEFYFRSHPVEASEATSIPETPWPQIIGRGNDIHFTFPEDGAPDSVELVNDVMVLTGSHYEYQGDTRTLPASEVIPEDDGFSFTVDPESFAQGEDACNVTYALCTWDGLTSVYSMVFRINA